MTEENFVSIDQVSVWYGMNLALNNINLSIPARSITAFIGPSGCGKTTLLRSINRLNDLIPVFRLEGDIRLDGESIYQSNKKQFVENLRKGIGMVFQQPNPLPDTVIKNMLLPGKEHLSVKESILKERAIEKLKLAGLYEEVKDRLNRNALLLSGGQQQRLCIARAMMLEPRLLLFDEPCSALDPISTMVIEDVLTTLKEKYTIIMVTHNMEQARRIADQTAFFYRGDLIENGDTEELFTNPKTELLTKYLSGSF